MKKYLAVVLAAVMLLGCMSIPAFADGPEDLESGFLTSFTLKKDYDDKYTAGAKTTAVNEGLTFTIAPVTTGAPAFDSNTFTMTVTDGVGEAEVELPDLSEATTVGDYWYTITETAGTTAGVDYDDAPYYLHLIVSYKNGEFGFSSAVIRSSNDVTADEDGKYPDTGKIDTVSNSYGEGKLVITQESKVDGEANNYDDFGVTVTFALPEGTELSGDITFGDDQTVLFADGVGTATINFNIKGGESVIFEHIPDGTTYEVTQTKSNPELGYGDPDYTITEETGDEVVTESGKEIKVIGTISDGEDVIAIANETATPIDVGVILENGAFIVLALGAIAGGVWLIISKRRKALDAE